MLIKQVISNVFEGFELSDIQSMFGYTDVTQPTQLEQAYMTMNHVMEAGKLDDLKYVVNCFKSAGLLIRPTHMIKNGKSWVGAWIWEGQNGSACCIACGYEVRMTKPKEAVPVEQWLAENEYTPVMCMRPVADGAAAGAFVLGYKVEGNQYVCKLSRLLPNCHPRAKTCLDVDNNVRISIRS